MIQLETLDHIGGSFSEVANYQKFNLIHGVIFSLIGIILSFTFATGAYFAKRWTWLGSLMLSFYFLLSKASTATTQIGFFIIYGENVPIGNFSFIGHLSILFLAIAMICLYLRANTKSYFKDKKRDFLKIAND